MNSTKRNSNFAKNTDTKATLFVFLLTFFASIALAQPGNDNPCNAIPLTAGTSCSYTSGTNVGATASSGIPAPGCANYQSSDVWYSIVVPASGSIYLEGASGTMTDGGMAAYTGTCSALTLISGGCDDDSGPGNMPALSLTGQTPGTTIYIRFWGRGRNNTGTFQICATMPPNNDEPCNATTIPVSTTGCNYSTYSNTNATNTTNVPTPSCANYAGGDVWFRVTVPSSGSLILNSNTGGITDGGMAVYSGSCSALAALSCDDDASTNGLMPSLTISNRTPGEVLFVRFWSYDNIQSGTFSLCANQYTPLPPTNQDCPNAIPICQDIYTVGTSYSGTGNITNEIDPISSCLNDGERNDVWYTFTVQQSGNLNFTITPNSMLDDYDWEVFNLTNASCAEIATNPALSVSCNFSAIDGTTGPNGGSNLTNQNAFGTPFNRVIPVTAGQTYVINVSNFSSTQSGYSIDFGASSATIFDNIPPRLTLLNQTATCGSTQLTFDFSENILCSTIQNGDFAVTGPGGPYTVTGWSSTGCANGGVYGRTVTINFSPAIRTSGSYQLCLTNSSASVTDLCGNVAPPACLNFTITPIQVTSATTPISCYNGANGSATVSPISGISPYNYSWSPNVGSTATVNNLVSGSYTVTITDANGCTTSQSVLITQPNPIVTTLTPTLPGCNLSNGSIRTTTSGGTPVYTYSWSPSGGTGATASGLSVGTYTVTITDSQGCTATNSTTLTSATVLVNITNSQSATCGNANGSITVVASGGTGPYNYAWTPIGGNSATANNLPGGTYSCVVTDVAGCSASVTTTIGTPSTLAATVVSTTNVTCFGGTDGAATVSVSGGAPNYNYSWLPSGGSTASASNLAAGNYTVTITDAAGCITSTNVTITAPPVIIPTVTPTQITCNGLNDGSATASATGGVPGYTYSWSPSGSGASINNLSAGSYTVTVTDASGCSSTTTASISEPTQLTAIASALPVSCSGGTGTINVAPAGGTPTYTYLWSPSGGTGSSASGLTAGNYTVVVTDSRGCTSSSTATIIIPAPITLTPITTNVLCAGASTGSASITPNGGTPVYSFSWSPNVSSTSSANNIPAGNYLVTITDGSGCTATTSISISQPSAISASVTPTAVTCNGLANGSATVNAIGGTPSYNFNWSSSGGTNATANGLPAGNYTVTITDANGCTQTAATTITQPAPIVISPSTSPATCNGTATGTATANVSGGSPGYSYSWLPGNASTSGISGLTAGSYIVTTTDQLGCTASATLTVTQPAPISATASSSPATCGSSNGSASVTVNGGIGQLTYSWSPSGGSSSSASTLAPGSYTVTITDANGCTASATSLITNIGGPTITASATGQVSCTGGANGSAAVTVLSGTGPFTYLWSPSGGNTLNAVGLSAGNYSVTVTDASGCVSGASVTITERPAISLVTSTTNTTCGASNGSASVIATGGNAPYNYLWSPTGGNANIANNLSTGNYVVTVTDGSGCSTSTTATVGQAPTLNANIASTPVTCNGGSDGTASVNITSGVGGYSYSWSPLSSNTANLTGAPAGTYTVTIRDANNCSYTFTTTITEATAIAITSSVTPSNCSSSTGTATLSVNGGAGAYSYQWTPNVSNSNTASALSAGNYSVIVTDQNNCSSSATIAISNLNGPNSILASSSDVSCNGGADGSAVINTSGGTFPYTYSWQPSGGSSSSSDSLSAGNYSVIVTDAGGCITPVNFTINEPAAINLQSTVNAATCVASNGSVTITATGGAGSFTYSWSPYGGNGATASNLAAGNYTVTVTDGNNCTSTASATVLGNAGANVIMQSYTDVSCNGGNNGSAVISASGGTPPYSYNWLPNGGTNSLANNLTAGNYTVVVTDFNNCSSSVLIIISEPAPIVLTTSSTPASCNGGSDGSVSVVASGGLAPYNYHWDDPAASTTNTVTNLPIGNYNLLVTDANGCNQGTFAIVNSNSSISANSIQNDVTCNGLSNGTASVVANGGTPPYTYSWAPSGGNTAVASNLSSGNYSVTITDANGCAFISSILIDEPPPISVVVTGDTTICAGQSALIQTTVSGGIAPYSYLWNNGSTQSSQNTFAEGSYSVLVTDSNGCTLNSNNVSVNVHPPLAISVTPDVNICTGGQANFAVTATGGDANYTYNWNNNYNQATGTISPLSDTTLTVTVNDGCNQTIMQQVNVYINQNPTAAFGPGFSSGCVPHTVSFINQSNYPTGSTFQWLFGDSTSSVDSDPTHVYNTPGVYNVGLTVTTAIGCSASVTLPFIVNALANPIAAFSTSASEVAQTDPPIFFYNNSSFANQYIWNFGDNTGNFTDPNPTHLYQDTGTYTVTLISINSDGCVDTIQGLIKVTESFSVFIPNALTVNGDNNNETFNAYGVGWKDFEMFILDRWGLTIYHTTDHTKPWDGSYQANGTACQADVYIYKILLHDLKGELHTYIGDVTLVH